MSKLRAKFAIEIIAIFDEDHLRETSMDSLFEMPLATWIAYLLDFMSKIAWKVETSTYILYAWLIIIIICMLLGVLVEILLVLHL